MFVFENEEHDKASPQGEEEAPIYNLMDHLGLNLPQASGEVEDNSSLEIPGNYVTKLTMVKSFPHL